MKQQLNAIFDEDRGVSPVIGVILMVAITVILAAVIGTFVLGLGDSLEQAPQSTLSADSGNSTSINVSHDGGDAMDVDDLQVNIDGDTNDFSVAEDFESGDEFSVGDTAVFEDGNLDNGEIDSGENRIRVIHTPSDSVVMDKTVDVP